MRLDMNADVGEHDGPPLEDALALLRLVTSANIACGAHAGDDESMRLTARAAAAGGVQVGAHPSFPDREGFGRRVLPLSPAQVRDEVARQVQRLAGLAALEGVPVRHVKPHGALYNLAGHDRRVAEAIVAGIVAVDAALALYAPHGTALADAGHAAGLRVVAEGFLDRAYEDDGSLTSRAVEGAVLHDADAASVRALAWVRTGLVTARSGQLIRLPLETLCVHGDTPGAAAMAARVRAALRAAGVRIVPALAPSEDRA
ncbi:LamB/YcsF family protein [Luteitalea sp. TBR-22]|uniref:LamB/YcsF family protein n=1 Tax=Luteitalea sp. TBR-22 TaxID=2802971 RepID=UPI001EF58C48|nr:5-oxoprolinase subunit PxpA [Luteitalea sp. TBR-22]